MFIASVKLGQRHKNRTERRRAAREALQALSGPAPASVLRGQDRRDRSPRQAVDVEAEQSNVLQANGGRKDSIAAVAIVVPAEVIHSTQWSHLVEILAVERAAGGGCCQAMGHHHEGKEADSTVRRCLASASTLAVSRFG